MEIMLTSVIHAQKTASDLTTRDSYFAILVEVFTKTQKTQISRIS